jgi:hypothetical protein
MKKKVWVHKARSFKDAERFEVRYYRSMSPKERVDTVDFLRQLYRKIKRRNGGTRLRRVLRVIQ